MKSKESPWNGNLGNTSRLLREYIPGRSVWTACELNVCMALNQIGK